jgi:predicted nucleic-acid-binding protein
MSIVIDTNVLVRILVQDPTVPDRCAAARRPVVDAKAAGEPWLVRLCALLEAPGIEFEHDATVEEALYGLDQFPGADFADCALVARAAHLGRSRFVTFDAGVARLPRGERLQ